MSDTCKVILLGNSGVGKSSILTHLMGKNPFLGVESTIGVDYGSIVSSYKDRKIKINIWDTAGQERYSRLIRSYYQNIDIAIIVYSVIDIDSFNNIQFWMNELSRTAEGFHIIIVANKTDLNTLRQVKEQEGTQLANVLNIPYLECNIHDLESVRVLKNKITEIFYQELILRDGLNTPPIKERISFTQKKRNSCCL